MSTLGESVPATSLMSTRLKSLTDPSARPRPEDIHEDFPPFKKRTSSSIRKIWWSRECLQQASEDSADARKHLDVRLTLESIVAGKLCLDITHAISCLPAGWLWGEKIGSTKVAAIATTSSVIGIAMYFAKKRLLK